MARSATVYSSEVVLTMPWPRPGPFCCSGAVAASETEHFTGDGRPLITAAQCGEIYGVKARTIYQWRRRGHLKVRGLAPDGQWLFDAGEVASVAGKPWRRRREPAAA